MKVEGKELQDRYKYEFEYWKNTSGFEPVELLATFDNAGSYERSELHIFKLKRGYAIVHESGWSRYESSDADIDIKATLEDVKDTLKNNSKDNYQIGELSRECLKQLMGSK